jgi:hypothetical protein
MIDYVSIRDKMLRRREGSALSAALLSFDNMLKYNKLN